MSPNLFEPACSREEAAGVGQPFTKTEARRQMSDIGNQTSKMSFTAKRYLTSDI